MAAPVVSVLVPARDVAPWVEAALRSVLDQSLREIEVILVDDASSDASWEIVARLAALDPRLRPVRREVNAGTATARNDALALARGAWLAVFDADDLMAPERLARLLAAAERHGADWIADDQWILAEGKGWPPARLLLDAPAGASPLDLASFLDRDPPEAIGYGTLKPLIRRAFLERHGLRWRAEAGRSEDFVMTVRCLAAGASAWLLAEPLYHYRLRGGSQVTGISGLATLPHLLEVQGLVEAMLRGHPDAAVHRALARRRERAEAALAYRRTVEDLRAGRPAAALGALLRHPRLAALVGTGLLEALGRRVRGGRVPTLANRRLFRGPRG